MENKFKYNGKEEQRQEFSDGSGLEWMDYGARMYDAQIGRFFTQDRFADMYLSFAPYQYCAGNPISFIDENGDYITIDKRNEKGDVVLSLLYEGGKAYLYSMDSKGNVTKGDAWDGEDDFISQSVTDLNNVASTKQGGNVVNDLVGSKFQYSIKEASSLGGSGFGAVDGSKGGCEIFYYQKGGSHSDARINKSVVVLGHELYHGWAFEFTNEPKGMNFGDKLIRETSAVKFENYLRASFGEISMRTQYTLDNSRNKVASSSVSEAKLYSLPRANYLKSRQLFDYDRKLPQDADNTVQKKLLSPSQTIDTRTQKF